MVCSGGGRGTLDSMGIENPDADVAEQLQSPEDGDEPVEDGRDVPSEVPSEADPADVAEQRIAVPHDDDYDR